MSGNGDSASAIGRQAGFGLVAPMENKEEENGENIYAWN